MSKSGLFAHFGSKEELQLATIAAAREIFIAEVVAPARAGRARPAAARGADRGLARLPAARGVRRRLLLRRRARRVRQPPARPGARRDPRRLRDLVGAPRQPGARRRRRAGHLDPEADPEQVAYELDALGGAANVRFQLDRDEAWFDRARAPIRERLDALPHGRSSAHSLGSLDGRRRALQEETADVLSRLIRFNTVNPPGDERACQEWLAAYLRDAGLEVELMGAEPERPNLVATLRGDEPGPVLGYLSHVDTVLADPDDWTHDPWSGDIHDGYLWGRGALDMKSPDRRRGRRGGHARAQRLAARARRAEGDLGGRRGGRRPPRRAVADRAAAGRRARGLAAQRGRRDRDAVRRPAAVRRLLRREGHLPLPRARPRRGRARLGARAPATTRCSSSRR